MITKFPDFFPWFKMKFPDFSLIFSKKGDFPWLSLIWKRDFEIPWFSLIFPDAGHPDNYSFWPLYSCPLRNILANHHKYLFLIKCLFDM